MRPTCPELQEDQAISFVHRGGNQFPSFDLLQTVNSGRPSVALSLLGHLSCLTTVLVLDQDAAIEFYTRKLGFELREDKSFGESRWFTISLPKNSDLTLAARAGQDG